MFAKTIANARSLRLAIALACSLCLLPGGLVKAQEARFSNMKEAMKALAEQHRQQMTQPRRQTASPSDDLRGTRRRQRQLAHRPGPDRSAQRP